MKTYKFKEVIKKLKKHDKRFEFHDSGKGSHRAIYHPNINGRAASMTIPCHGEGTDVKLPYLGNIVHKFNLPKGFFRN